MKATGIVRRIDDLGRVVIPKEMRRTLRIKEGDPLEIFVSDDGGVILHKYSAMTDLSEIASQFAESLSKAAGLLTLIGDRDTVIAAGGSGHREYMGCRIPPALLARMEERAVAVLRERKDIQPVFFEGRDASEIRGMMITPILAHGDIMGGVFMLTTDGSALGETEKKLSQSAASVLGRQLEE